MNTKAFLSFLFLLFIAFQSNAQIITLSPSSPTADEPLTITFDASEGTAGLVGESSVYMHSGVTTPDGDWQNVVGNWGQDDGFGKMTSIGNDKWQITMNSVREYYGLDANETIFKLNMVFRNADGSAEGKGTPGDFPGGTVLSNGDILIDINPGDFVSLTAPAQSTINLTSPGGDVEITGTASATATTLSISIDEGSGFQSVATTTNATEISYTYNATQSVNLSIKIEGEINGSSYSDDKTVNIVVRDPNNIADLPAGIVDGINYHEDKTKVTLSLLAPNKSFVYVVGDFTDWQIKDEYLMNQTPDLERYWIEITGLTPGQEYIFQYWVDGERKVGDPFADKVADPWNDQHIDEETYPGLIDYTKTEHGFATVLQTDQTPYEWNASEDTWVRPEKEDLVIYELLVRDFIGSHNYKDLADSLSYLKTLGVNAIELMPIMEFEGNESWGYNPSYFFAPDKYYGTKNDLKAFIEKAHQEGMAVILDMVLNHATGGFPYAWMYWNSSTNQTAADNPFFNETAKHPFNVFHDFNHESQYTKDFVDKVNAYWIEEYHFDGYRFDLSKGFTQNDTGDDVGAWGAYDQSRIDLLNRMADKIWDIDDKAYIILEHFADGSEESELQSSGMLTWGNLNHTYNDIIKGNTNADFGGALTDGRVSYMESHDEQRNMYEAINFGQVSGNYNIRDLNTALERAKMGAAFFYTVPGPKMTWQFQELGYDIDINFNGRVGNKPLVWGGGANSVEYYEDAQRQRLYGATAAIINLTHDYEEVFEEGAFTWKSTGNTPRINITHSTMDVAIVGNFGTSTKSSFPNFSKAGTWYDFFTGKPYIVEQTSQEITLEPGEFHIFTSIQLTAPKAGLVDSDVPDIETGLNFEDISHTINTFPNPTYKNLNIAMNNNLVGEIRTRLINLTGQTQKTFINNKEQINDIISIDVSSVPSGLYLLEIIQGNKRAVSKVLIKN